VSILSTEDIRAGSRWNQKISEELAHTHFGILCLTAENQNAPWVLFEAGALAKALETAFVCPYLIDLSPSDLGNSPLSQFQAKQANKEQTWELVLTINRALEREAYPEERLQIIFDRFCPDLELTLGKLPENTFEQIIKNPLEDMVKDAIKEMHEIRRELEVGRLVEKGSFEETLREVRGIRHDIEAGMKVEAALKCSEAYARDLQDKLEVTCQQAAELEQFRLQDQRQIRELQEELKTAHERITDLESLLQSKVLNTAEGLWEALQQRVTERRPPLGGHMQHGRPLSFDEHKLVVGFANKFSLEYLRDPENLGVLRDAAQTLLGRSFNIALEYKEKAI
jgi:hypothetical protein